MRKRMWMIGLLVVIALAALPLTTFAQSGRGTGSVSAEGDGLAYLRGEGWVRISGSGTLVIRDRAGDAVIEVTGQGRHAERGGTLYYHGFNGEVYVEGSAITVALRGEDITLEAEGTGVVILRGEGTYEFNGEQGQWTPVGVRLQTTSAAATQ